MARDIPNLVYLALPAEEFAKASVLDAGGDWGDRYYALLKKRPPHILAETEKDSDLTVWQRNNLWILHRGLVNGGANMTLLALWDGKAGDGAGGTEDMVNQARDRGARVVRIGEKTIFGR